MIRRTFERLAARDEMALMPYLTAGFPTLRESMQHVQTIAEGGADLIEIGVPFSDPVADGPTIQRASQHALDGGVRLEQILEAVAALDIEVPLILMSYLNPLLAHGRDEVLRDLRGAGCHGLIVPDLPCEESAPWRQAAQRKGIDSGQLVAPTSTPERTRKVASCSPGRG